MGKTLQSIKFSSIVVALLFFFMPWQVVLVNNGKPVAYQSGWNVMFGELTPIRDKDSNSSASETREDTPKEKKSAIESAPITMIGFGFLIAALVLSGISLFGKKPKLQLYAAISCTLALAAVVAQTMIGFPVKDFIKMAAIATWVYGIPILGVGKIFVGFSVMFFVQLAALLTPGLLYLIWLGSGGNKKRKRPTGVVMPPRARPRRPSQVPNIAPQPPIPPAESSPQ